MAKKQECIKEEANMRFDAGLAVEGALILSSQIELLTFYPSDNLNRETRAYLKSIIETDKKSEPTSESIINTNRDSEVGSSYQSR